MKKIICVLLCIIMTVAMTGCKNKKEEKPVETTALPDVETVAINAGSVKVYLDEAKYYAYTSQATYETYFISEGKEIDWSSEAKDGKTWQEVVKSLVLDGICRRECMYELRKEYNVTLTDEEKDGVKTKVSNYIKDSSTNISRKIAISEERLTEVFEKEAIAGKLEDILNAEKKNQADEIYDRWKEENVVTGTAAWKDVNFDEAIFTLEEIEWVSEETQKDK